MCAIRGAFLWGLHFVDKAGAERESSEQERAVIAPVRPTTPGGRGRVGRAAGGGMTGTGGRVPPGPPRREAPGSSASCGRTGSA